MSPQMEVLVALAIANWTLGVLFLIWTRVYDKRRRA